MIYPKKKMLQMKGGTELAEAQLQGSERIYSQEDTRKIIDMAKSAKTNRDYAKLGEFIYEATGKQDLREEQYV
jgi:hypothetical protein